MSFECAEPTIVSERIDVSDVVEVLGQYAEVDGPAGLWRIELDWCDPDTQYHVIDSLEYGYRVLNPILSEIRRMDDGTYVASFEEANIRINAESAHDAYQDLLTEILDTFDTLLSEPRLGRDAARQLEILKTFIGKA